MCDNQCYINIRGIPQSEKFFLHAATTLIPIIQMETKFTQQLIVFHYLLSNPMFLLRIVSAELQQWKYQERIQSGGAWLGEPSQGIIGTLPLSISTSSKLNWLKHKMYLDKRVIPWNLWWVFTLEYQNTLELITEKMQL